MAKFVSFPEGQRQRELPTGATLWVNPDSVTAIVPYSNAVSIIYLTGGTEVVVALPAASIAAELAS